MVFLHPHCRVRNGNGEVAEWLKAHAWKACLLERVTRVRIPVSPQKRSRTHEEFRLRFFLKALQYLGGNQSHVRTELKAWNVDWDGIGLHHPAWLLLQSLSPSGGRIRFCSGHVALLLRFHPGSDGRAFQEGTGRAGFGEPIFQYDDFRSAIQSDALAVCQFSNRLECEHHPVWHLATPFFKDFQDPVE